MVGFAAIVEEGDGGTIPSFETVFDVVRRFGIFDFEAAAVAEGGGSVPTVVGEAAAAEGGLPAFDDGEAVAAGFGESAIGKCRTATPDEGHRKAFSAGRKGRMAEGDAAHGCAFGIGTDGDGTAVFRAALDHGQGGVTSP